MYGHHDALDKLIPWSLFERFHQRFKLIVPEANRSTVIFVRNYAATQRMPRSIAIVCLAEEGTEKPHWWAPIEDNFTYSVSLPKSRFVVWIVQIDSASLTASFAIQNKSAWTVETYS